MMVIFTCRAVSGQGLNQSMVQQFTRAGNCLNRARKISPIGLEYTEVIKFVMVVKYLFNITSW